MMETTFIKISVPQNEFSQRRLPLSFPHTFLMLLRNIEQKRIPLNLTLLGAKISELSKIYQNVVAFFY